MRYLLFFALLCSGSLIAHEIEEGSLSIHSELAQYSDKHILLKDNVCVEHDLGTITADQIEIFPETINDKTTFKRIVMEGKVNIALKDGGNLQCDRAEIDFKDREGLFSSCHGNNVIYTENCNKNNTTPPAPLVLTSKSMRIYLFKEKDESKKSRNCIEHISADDSVTINYNKIYLATADYASYQRYSDKASQCAHALPGLIVLHSANKPAGCSITNGSGDTILADRISIDTVNRQIFFDYPQGTLHVTRERGMHELVDFSSHTLSWDEQTHILNLSKHVVVSQQGIGILTTDDQIQFIQMPTSEGAYELHAIESVGKTILRRVDAEHGTAQTLTCHGTARINHKDFQLTMTSPTDNQGNVLKDKQVLFQDEMGEILADKLTLYYAMENQTFTPSKLVLESHVRLKNHGAIDPAKTKIFLEYALADILEYIPKTKELILSAIDKKRVLFFDRINNLQVSAPALKVYRNGQSQEPEIQGVGDVRFKFVKRELNEIRKQFPIEDILNEGKDVGRE